MAPEGNCLKILLLPGGRFVMECPHCGRSISDETCAACGRTVPVDSTYCCWCGANLSTETAEAPEGSDSSEQEDAAIDFASRILCSDGTCIGVIGPDGRCKECGKPYSGDPEED